MFILLAFKRFLGAGLLKMELLCCTNGATKFTAYTAR